ncbi:Crp/Fnr family transcriptional regulator [Chryseobacterium sp. PTM-20240506]|jgi:CRP-like cAMP-binding protein|uniref:Crp/Fnr family transcriptional regulator n=1 Tax=unclassified Chryseobacterium TaxID=2593645 RepID=UPI0023594110|nr:Crp/Fnr family transcriptional regulator [Chryseobacterium sp. B21-037]MDC8107134.1 Crp/Fnr family transcriptional regulator [Chryseobacterium sp. B21-037]WBV56329.1 Crp/Fnr family transcriptional regulator [Chryseobacterium daecheongense]
MIIGEELLIKHGAVNKYFAPGEIIFREDSTPNQYFQIVTGMVELFNFHQNGREFTHNILYDGQSIGESLLFTEKPYPMSAIAKTDCNILCLGRNEFTSLAAQNFDVMQNLLQCMSERLYHKYVMLFNMSSIEPSVKIKTILDYIKDYNLRNISDAFEVPFTRQQIANLTGMAVETVIRTIKKMEADNILTIEKGKILY